ncbi:MAG: energy transducer TonB [Deltaproteobacteria bacterium]|nr:energy transducer TonB [Deltaproteobacteria bacterium]
MPKPGSGTAGWSIVASVATHGALLGLAALVAYHLTQSREARMAESRTLAPGGAVAIELPSFSEGSLLVDRVEIPEGTPPDAHGGATMARVDTGSLGKGGTPSGEKAVNLASIDDAMKKSPDLRSHLDRDQDQRMRTAKFRTTHEDRRATTNPMELTFLATGSGEQQERRANAPVDPSRGSLIAPRASVAGGHAGTRSNEEAEGPGASPGAARPGQLLASPGVGVRNGEPGPRHHEGARIAYARPAVTEGSPTVTANYAGRPNDTIDSDQEVAAIIQSHVRASYAGGVGGEGRGGSAGPAPDPGAGGSAGAGSVAKPLGAGDGDVFDWYSNDPNLMPYLRKIHAKVNPLWKDAFPKSAMIELKQGTVILEFTVALDGTVSVHWPPTRPSGIEEFDRNCADAIRRAGPFEPIPAALREQGRTRLHIRAPFVAKNPIVK